MSTDPILDAILGEEEGDVETEAFSSGDYGKGDWPFAKLVDVVAQENDFGRSFRLAVNLKGDEMPFNFFVEFPGEAPVENGDSEKYERDLKRWNIKVNRFKTIVHATGTLVTFNDKGKATEKGWRKSLNTDFAKATALLQNLVGATMPIRVKYREYEAKDGSTKSQKDVWGLTPKAVPF